MIIPHEQLSEAALTGLIEEFVTREGTDYGERDTALGEKVRQVLAQLDRGEARIVFDPGSGSVDIVPAADAAGLELRHP